MIRSRGLRGRIAVTLVAGCLGALAATGAAEASVVQAGGGSVQIEGDADTDNITMSSDGTTLTVTDTGAGGVTAMTGCSQVNGTTAACPLTPLGGVRLRFFFATLGDGVDSFTNQNFEADGQVFNFEQTGSKTIDGGPGDQFIGGGGDSDTLNGGAGDDSLFDGANDSDAPTGGDDALIGGPGHDATSYGRGTATPMTVTLDGVANDGYPGEFDNVQTEDVSTGAGDDVIVGDADPNALAGFGGADRVSGMGGGDDLSGDFNSGAGMVTRITGDPAVNDVVDGGAGRDDIDCGISLDVALHDAADNVAPNCERIGALPAGESAEVRAKRKAKVPLICPSAEAASCVGKVVVTVGGKKLAKGKFSIAAGATKRVAAKLSKQGLRRLNAAGGSLLTTTSVVTNELDGSATNADRVLVYR